MDSKAEKEQVIKKIAEREYNLFVVNTHAAGIQQRDGRYITKYFPLSSFILEQMILRNGSMGCYQQGYKTNRIRWICYDFDCKDKENPEIADMYKNFIKPLTITLKKLGIRYLTEFSGRRGVHVWIIFNALLSKKTGYRILNEIEKRCFELREIKNSEKWSLDKFPATESSYNNIVGKQVKFPLSSHKSGDKSYFFYGNFYRKDDIDSLDFYKEQLNILSSYEQNDVDEVIKVLELEKSDEESKKPIYYKFVLTEDVEVTPDKVIEVLSETDVFRQIFKRMESGRGLHQDWMVLFGTLSQCDSSTQLLKNILKKFPNYDESKTQINIFRLKDKYYPATFGYLYQIYNIEMEDNLDENETGFCYLLRRCNLNKNILKKFQNINERKSFCDLNSILNKEKKYLRTNDEVADVLIWNDLCGLKQLDLWIYEEIIEKIKLNKENDYIPKDFKVFERIESPEKKRILVSLSAKDRVITTHLAIQLSYLMKKKWKSFSYQISYTSQDSIFFNWYSSWSNYINHIRIFTEIPFMEDYRAFYIDLKDFYKNIDFLSVFRTFEKFLEGEAKNIFVFLMNFNDSLMKSIQNGNRIGVPQGPAYARIISEMYLDKLLERALAKWGKKHFYMYRYVDDIIFFCEPNIDSLKLYEGIKEYLIFSGLPINSKKTKYFGRLKDLTVEERRTLLHEDSFNYELNENIYTGILLENERRLKLNKYLHENDFGIEKINYFFGRYVFPEVQDWCMKYYSEDILKSLEGRGNNFRTFYNFLFSQERYLVDFLDNEKFNLIPIKSLNFSNFIHELYYSTQNESISRRLFNRIKKEYLKKIPLDYVKEDDKTIIQALILIEM
ncbi:reverse transcriptase domain-containing protein [Dubosiella muris]|uniref:Uncharacterized protein n=1 Tax=Dubosiella muris TaxID=3038133 RepID=A0AC61R852_9FIRM|nr:reverse transcriptase domain-containing protein [Dubosiella muris]TGY66193.1 hypothetical protein E5336_04930 [Dubosiella muris]